VSVLRSSDHDCIQTTQLDETIKTTHKVRYGHEG
jgi:hypothetical protein